MQAEIALNKIALNKIALNKNDDRTEIIFNPK